MQPLFRATRPCDVFREKQFIEPDTVICPSDCAGANDVLVTDSEFLKIMIKCGLYDELDRWLDKANSDELGMFMSVLENTVECQAISLLVRACMRRSELREAWMRFPTESFLTLLSKARKDKYLLSFLLHPKLVGFANWKTIIVKTVRNYKDVSVLPMNVENIAPIQERLRELELYDGNYDSWNVCSKIAFQYLTWIMNQDMDYFQEHVAPYLEEKEVYSSHVDTEERI